MEQYFIFILIATLITVSTEAWKKVIDEIIFLTTGVKEWYDINVGIFLPIVLSLFGVFALGYGVLGVFIPGYTNIALKIFDLFITASVASLGANGVYQIIDTILDKK